MLIYIDGKDELGLEDAVRNDKNPKEVDANIKRVSGEILNGKNEKIISVAKKQGKLLKWFKQADDFFDGVHLSWSNIYFKIYLCKFLTKFPVLKNWTHPSSYFKE